MGIRRTEQEYLEELKKHFKQVEVTEVYLKASGEKVFMVKTEKLERTAPTRYEALRLARYHAIDRGLMPKIKPHLPGSR